VPFGLGIWEIVILAVVLMLLFGAKGLPTMARRLGTGVREVKDAVEEINPRTLLDPKDEPKADVAPAQRVIEASPAQRAETPADRAVRSESETPPS
jgi:sec-independent protein translocase protein TatA